jgi:hypothetical protein
MIAKVPLRRIDGGSSFADLVQYVIKDAAATTHSTEVWSIDEAPHEMEQVASFSRAKNPVYHYVLSWREAENPSDREAFAAVKATLTALGMHDNQWVAATHRNTNNVHAHVAVNRVSPETYKAVSIFQDWLILDRTCREIEVEHGWLHDNGPHRVEPGNGAQRVVRTRRERSNDVSPAPSTRARNFAAWNGRDSFQEWIGKEPAQRIKLALLRPDASWNDVHRVLSIFNLEYRTKGSGAVIVDITEPDNLHAKASHLSRFASRGRLEARLGPYKEPTDAPPKKIVNSYRMDVEERRLQVEGQTQERKALYERFKQKMADWQDSKTRINEVAWQQQRETERSRRSQLSDENRNLRLWIHSSAPKCEKRVLRSLDSIRAAVKREDLRIQVNQERKQLRARLCGRSPGPWREWLVREADAGDTIAGEALRRLRCRISTQRQIDRSQSEFGNVASPEMTRNAVLCNLAWSVDAAGINYIYDGRTIFSDEGQRIAFRDLGDAHIRAGLALAREKWAHGVYLTGTNSFREKTTAVAAELGIQIRGGALRQAATLDFQALSCSFGKPIFDGKLRAGQQHTGKLVAATTDVGGDGVFVVDVGRELAVIRAGSAAAVGSEPKVGMLVRAFACHSKMQINAPNKLVWQIRGIERTGPEHNLAIGR